MNAVLYTEQLEPITVVDIPMFLWDRLRRGERIMLPIWEDYSSIPAFAVTAIKMRTVTIFGEVFCRKGCEAMMLFTTDDENALLLKAAFLTGQRSTIQQARADAFVTGFLTALGKAR